MEPKKFAEWLAGFVIFAAVAIVLLTAYGVWLKLFWYGWVMAGAF